MSWLRIDDAITDHPKFIGLSLSAQGLWLNGLVYSGRNLTDGFIPNAAVARALATHQGGDENAILDELCESGLWTPNDLGYMIHDYLDYNPSKDDVMHRREVRSEAGRRGGQASAISRAKPRVEPKSQQNGSKVERLSNPIPVPIPKEKEILWSDFDEWWTKYPRKVKKQSALASWRNLSKSEQQQAMSAIDKWLPYLATKDIEFIPHPSSWLNQKRWQDELPQTTTKVRNPNQGWSYPKLEDEL